MEHYYTKIEDNMFTYPGLYQEMVKTFITGSKFAEIGCWKGQSTAYMAVEIANSKRDIELYCIDVWKGDGVYTSEEELNNISESESTSNELYNIFLKNMEPVKHIVKPIRKTSIEASKDFPDEYFDFVFLDANHDYEKIKEDIIHWYPKVKRGGVFAGHDLAWTGVRKAVTELLKEAVYEQELCWRIKKHHMFCSTF